MGLLSPSTETIAGSAEPTTSIRPFAKRFAPRNVFLNSSETYLAAMYELEEEGRPPRRVTLSRRLGVNASSVSDQLSRMERDGLVLLGPERQVELTASGRAAAQILVRKHRLAERMLVDIVGLEWELCHEQATLLQHLISHRVERKLLDLLDDPTRSPFGNPIPFLDELDPTRPPARVADDGPGVSLLALAGQIISRGRVHHIHEGLQSRREILGLLTVAGVVPGAVVTVTHVDDEVEIRSTAGTSVLDRTAARSIVAVPLWE